MDPHIFIGKGFQNPFPAWMVSHCSPRTSSFVTSNASNGTRFSNCVQPGESRPSVTRFPPTKNSPYPSATAYQVALRTVPLMRICLPKTGLAMPANWSFSLLSRSLERVIHSAFQSRLFNRDVRKVCDSDHCVGTSLMMARTRHVTSCRLSNGRDSKVKTLGWEGLLRSVQSALDVLTSISYPGCWTFRPFMPSKDQRSSGYARETTLPAP